MRIFLSHADPRTVQIGFKLERIIDIEIDDPAWRNIGWPNHLS